MSYATNRIRILPEELVNKIAAGEIIERPASVLKELIENSLDAEAGRLEIVVRNGGKSLIQVRDDGTGMSRDEVISSLDRHATSKIIEEKDLTSINTLGFRGEALSSIASVSNMLISSRIRSDISGTEVRVDGGKLLSVRETGLPPGTIVKVQRLFYNIPARKKFLKSSAVEQRHVSDLITGYAIGRPGTAIRFVSNGKLVLSLQHGSSIFERIHALLGKEIAEHLLELDGEAGGTRIRGYIGTPETVRSSRSFQFLFVNGRIVKDRLLSGAIFSVYRDLIPRGRYPVYVLFIDVDPSEIDVNIHPAKEEVRFSNERVLREDIRRLLQTRLKESIGARESEYPFIPSGLNDAKQSMNSGLPSMAGKKEDREDEGLSVSGGISPYGVADEAEKLTVQTALDLNDVPPDPILSEKDRKQPVKYWQFQQTYIFCQVKGELLIIDQHVAHERVIFEKVMRMLHEEATAVQPCLFPRTLQLTLGELPVYEENRQFLKNAGYSLRLFSDRTLVVDGEPAGLLGADPVEILREFFSELSDGFGTTTLEKIATAYSCKAAIKAGRNLSDREIAWLVDSLFATEQPFICPHGRPVILQITLDELHRRFGRT